MGPFAPNVVVMDERVSRADALWLPWLALVGVVVFCLDVTALALAPLTLTMPLALATGRMRRGLANTHRRWAGRTLDTPVYAIYRRPDGAGVPRRVLTIVRDPATWRDLLWLFLNGIVGVFLSILSLILLLASVFYLIYPFLWWVTPPNVFDADYGLFQVHDVATACYVMPLGLVSFLLWFFGTATLLRTDARLARSLLRPVLPRRSEFDVRGHDDRAFERQAEVGSG